jgi:hypothetical protein
MAKSTPKTPKTPKPSRRNPKHLTVRDVHHRPPVEPDTNDTDDTGPWFPDPWYPDIAVHFYGLNWDLEHLPPSPTQERLEAALQRALPPGDHLFAYDATYPGQETSACLSFGYWHSQWPDHTADAARRRGLVEWRANGRRSTDAEALLGNGFLTGLIAQNVPSRVGGQGNTPQLDLSAVSVTPLLPATLRVSATYETVLPILGVVRPSCHTDIAFSAAGGNFSIAASDLDCGDFGLGTALVPQVVNIVGAWPLLVLGGLAFGGYALYCLANSQPVLPSLPKLNVGNALSLLPRDLPVDILKFTFDFRSPTFRTRGAASSSVLSIPIVYGLVMRNPSVGLTGPRSVTLPGGQRAVTYRAAASDFANPSFTWAVNGVRQPATTGPTVTLMLDAHTQQVGARRSFVVTVNAIDGLVSTFQASARLTTQGRVIDPPEDAPDPLGGGRWGPP